MNASRLLFYPGQVRAAAGLTDAVAHRDECVSLLGEAGAGTAALLDQTEYELSHQSVRCIRVSGSPAGELTLRDLVSQITGRGVAGALSDGDLKAGLTALSHPGEGYDRVALLITEAHSLLPSALHFIQLACQSSPRLRVVLAGEPGLAAILARDEFASLRQRITCTLELPGLAENGMADSGSGASWLNALRAVRSGPLARLGLVALLVALIGMIWWRHLPAPPAAVLQADAPPAFVPGRSAAVPVAAEAAPAASSMPLATPVPAEPAAPGMAEPAETPPDRAPPEPAAAADAPGPAERAVLPPPGNLPAAQAGSSLPDRPPAAEAGSPAAPDASSPAAPAAAKQDADAASAQKESPPPEPLPATAPVPQPGPDNSAAESSLSPAPDAAASVPEPSASPVRSEPPPTTPDRGSEQPDTETDRAGQASSQAPAPASAQAADAAPAAQNEAAASLPTPPIAARPSPAVPARRAQALRGSAERTAPRSAAPPAQLAAEQRCRDIVLQSQLGKDLSDADKQFLRGGCRGK